jgi:hypothetical protein
MEDPGPAPGQSTPSIQQEYVCIFLTADLNKQFWFVPSLPNLIGPWYTAVVLNKRDKRVSILT